MSSPIDRGYKLILSYLQAKIFNSLGIIGPIHRLVIAATYRCNSKCKTCDIWQTKYNPDEELTIQDFKEIRKSALVAKAEEVSLTGGEPFLRDDIVEIVKILCGNNKDRCSIVSNGILKERILSNMKDIIKHGIRSLRIVLSLNGKAETHDNMRGIPGNYNKVMGTMDGLKRLGVEVSIIFTITPDNYKEMLWAYQFAQENRIMINFFPEVNSYRFEKTTSIKCFTDEQKAEILLQLRDIYRRRRYYYFDDSNLLYVNKMFANERVCRCYAGVQSLFINAYGEVYPCEGFNDIKLSLGNIRQQSLDIIWKSAKADSVRKFIREGKCQICYLACEIIPSLRKEIFPVVGFMLQERLQKLRNVS